MIAGSFPQLPLSLRRRQILSSGCGSTCLWFEQDINKLDEGRFGLFVNFFDFDRADRMAHDEHRMVRRAERFFLGLC
jgi:hypothetical protein